MHSNWESSIFVLYNKKSNNVSKNTILIKTSMSKVQNDYPPQRNLKFILENRLFPLKLQENQENSHLSLVVIMITSDSIPLPFFLEKYFRLLWDIFIKNWWLIGWKSVIGQIMGLRQNYRWIQVFICTNMLLNFCLIIFLINSSHYLKLKY